MSPQLTTLFWKKMVRIAKNIVHCNQNHFFCPLFRDKWKIEKAKSKKIHFGGTYSQHNFVSKSFFEEEGSMSGLEFYCLHNLIFYAKCV